MVRMGIQVRLLVVVMACSLVIVGSLVSYAVSNFRNHFYEAQQKKIESIIRTIDVQVNTERDLKDMEKFRRLFSYLMEYDDELLQINLYAPIHGKYYVLASNDPRQIGTKVRPEELGVIRSGKTRLEEVQPGRVMEITAPIHVGFNPIAAMGFYLDISRQAELLQREISRMVLIGLAGTALLMGLLYLVVNTLILKPLGQLDEITRRVAKGDLSQRVEIDGYAELSQLGRSFNQMADRLLQRYQQGIIDEATGLPNYFYLKDRLAEELQQAGEDNKELAVLLLGFHKVYPWVGLTGEKVAWIVGEVARTVREKMPEGYTCARYSSRELAVIAPGVSGEGALALAWELAEAVSQRLTKVETDRFPAFIKAIPGIRAGIALRPTDGLEAETLLFKAEVALEAAGVAGERPVLLFGELAKEGGPGLPAPEVLEGYRRRGGLEVLQALNGMLEDKEALGRSHSAGVARYAAGLGSALGLSPEKIEYLITAALLHDIGRACAADTPEHCNHFGAILVERAGGPTEVAEIIRYQSEHFDGSGVPGGLRGEAIPLGARILTIADSFEHYLHKDGVLTPQKIEAGLDHLRACAGNKLDPKMVDVFMALMETGTAQVTEISA